MIKASVRVVACGLIAGVCAAGSASGQTVQRPIQDFVNAQTSTTGWNEPATGNQMFVDYANKVNTASSLGLPTGFTGKITEQPQADGRARVRVTLHTTNAYATASEGGVGFVFGSGVAEILGGAEAALADSHLTVDFINTAPGAPLPNHNNLIFLPRPGQEISALTLEATATGPLRALFGVPAGTPGMAHTTQRGLFAAPGKGQGLDNDFPAERIVIKKIGGK